MYVRSKSKPSSWYLTFFFETIDRRAMRSVVSSASLEFACVRGCPWKVRGWTLLYATKIFSKNEERLLKYKEWVCVGAGMRAVLTRLKLFCWRRSYRIQNCDLVVSFTDLSLPRSDRLDVPVARSNCLKYCWQGEICTYTGIFNAESLLGLLCKSSSKRKKKQRSKMH